MEIGTHIYLNNEKVYTRDDGSNGMLQMTCVN